jgi:hypothetical protein
MERLLCPKCYEIEEQHVAAVSRPVEYPCAYVLCPAFLQADFKMKVEGTDPALVSFGSPKPCTCDRRQERALTLTPHRAPPAETDIAQLQKYKRGSPTTSEEADRVRILMDRYEELITETLEASPERQTEIDLERDKIATKLKAIHQGHHRVP